MGWQGSVWAALLGLSFGSFSALVLDRLPRNESILWSRSRCSSCGHTLSAFELVPVVSYLCLGGRCKTCRKSIPARDFLIEVAAGAFAAAAWFQWGWPGCSAAIGLTTAGAFAWGTFRRVRPESKSEAGFTLLETILALAILTTVSVPVMMFYVRNMAAPYEVHAQLALANQVRAQLDSLVGSTPSNQDWTCANGKDLEWKWKVEAWSDPQNRAATNLYKATVTWRRNVCGTQPSSGVEQQVWTVFRLG